MNCFKCKGDLEDKNVNYVVDLDNRIIVIKSVPAKVCSKCGEKIFNDDTAKNIERIINNLKELSIEVTVINYKDKIA